MKASRLGLCVVALTASMQAQQQAIVDDFLGGITQTLLEVTDPFEASRQALIAQRQSDLATIELLADDGRIDRETRRESRSEVRQIFREGIRDLKEPTRGAIAAFVEQGRVVSALQADIEALGADFGALSLEAQALGLSTTALAESFESQRVALVGEFLPAHTDRQEGGRGELASHP